jgi:hypothetical protein
MRERLKALRNVGQTPVAQRQREPVGAGGTRSDIDDSPRMVRQRKQIDALIGSTAQRMAVVQLGGKGDAEPKKDEPKKDEPKQEAEPYNFYKEVTKSRRKAADPVHKAWEALKYNEHWAYMQDEAKKVEVMESDLKKEWWGSDTGSVSGWHWGSGW